MKNTTENAILEAAREEFFQKGFDGARTTTIAQKAGVTHAMLHYYFRTKEQLFEKILDQTAEIFAETLFSSLQTDSSKSLEEIVAQITGTHFDFISKDPRLPIFSINEVLPRENLRKIIFDVMSQRAFPTLFILRDRFAQEKPHINPLDLAIDMLSLNVFSVTTSHTISLALNLDEKEYLQRRREENINTILKRIQ